MKTTKQLPARADLGQLKRQAKDLLSGWKAGSSEARDRVEALHPRSKRPSAGSTGETLLLADAQLVLAREYGFPTWDQLRRRVETIDLADPITAFTEAACIPLDGSGHGTGDLQRAEAIRGQYSGVIGRDIFTAAMLADDATLARILAADPEKACETGGLYDWDPLSYLCFSKYLRLDKERRAAFVRSARVLLDHGASANTGFYWQEHSPDPTLETAIYGAAGVAQHAELTRLLLEHGADPNDGETAYHVAEGWDNATMKVLVDSGKLNEGSLTTLLHRKHDWHDYEAIKFLLEHGVDPNRISHWGRAALHQAVSRDNGLPFFELLLDHGADPTFVYSGTSAIALAARRGRGDLLELFERRGFRIELAGMDRLLAACSRNDVSSVHSIRDTEPQAVRDLLSEGVDRLVAFAGIGNTDGVRHLLDLGVDVAATQHQVEGYHGYAKESTALHVAAWRARHETVRLLIERGAPVEVPDGKANTPLALAVRACVDSYWTEMRSPDSVQALLDAGANVHSVKLFPSGYSEVDELLRAHGR